MANSRRSGRPRAAWLLAFLLGVTLAESYAAPERRRVVASTEYRARGRAHTWLLGHGYRRLRETPISVEVLDLSSFTGGLRPVMRVGGLQTSSLAMAGADGRSYTFRPVEKAPSMLVPPEFEGTPLQDLMEDLMSAQHPAGALVVSELSESLGVLEASPRLVVMADDPSLGEFREDFASRLGTISEYPTARSESSPGFRGIEAIVDTEELWEIYRRDVSGWPDAEAFLRARLLDQLVGDWDRHGGQWRWARVPGKRSLQPVAEDRDQAFSDYGGLVMDVARWMGLPQSARFEERFASIEDATLNGWAVDRLLLPRLEWSDWKRVARAVQQRITDETIQRAVDRMPSEYVALSGERLLELLRVRRDGLEEEARRFYEHLAGEVDLVLTDEDDRVELEWLAGGGLRIAARAISASGEAIPLFERRFHAAETREVRIYFLEGESRIVVTGRPEGGPDIHLITAGSLVIEGSRDRLRLFDLNRRSLAPYIDEMAAYGIPDPNEDVPWTHARDWGGTLKPMPFLDYANGAGFIPSFSLERRRYAFDRSPYAQRHFLEGGFALSALKPELLYQGELRRPGRGPFLSAETLLTGIEHLRYFGFGNETGAEGDESRFDMDRTSVTFFPALTWSKGPAFTASSLASPPERSTAFRIGPILTYGSSSAEPGSVLQEEQPYGIGRFGQLGLGAGFSYDGRTATKVRAPGFRVFLDSAYYFEVWDVEADFGTLEGQLVGYLPLGMPGLLAVSLEGKTVFGEAPFFEAAFLGGHGSLRGYGPNRFTGDASLLGSAELWVAVARLDTPVPGNIGILAGVETGRVFVEGESSSRWHPAAGGGVFFEMLQGLSVFSFSLFRGREETTYHFKVGFDF